MEQQGNPFLRELSDIPGDFQADLQFLHDAISPEVIQEEPSSPQSPQSNELSTQKPIKAFPSQNPIKYFPSQNPTERFPSQNPTKPDLDEGIPKVQDLILNWDKNDSPVVILELGQILFKDKKYEEESKYICNQIDQYRKNVLKDDEERDADDLSDLLNTFISHNPELYDLTCLTINNIFDRYQQFKIE